LDLPQLELRVPLSHSGVDAELCFIALSIADAVDCFRIIALGAMVILRKGTCQYFLLSGSIGVAGNPVVGSFEGIVPQRLKLALGTGNLPQR
jgi:hypothetical protein